MQVTQKLNIQRFSVPGTFEFWTSLLFVIIAYLPFIKSGFGEKAGIVMLGDVINLWAPQIYKTILHNKHFIFDGIDWFTHGGASEYFMRPNIFTHSPIVFVLSFFVHLSSLENLFRFVFFLYVLHAFLSCYFLQRLCLRFLNFDKNLSLFVATAFTFSVTSTRAFGFTPFLFTAMLLPAVIYASLVFSHSKPNLKTLIFCSIPSFIILLSGYITFSALSIVITALFCFFYWTYIHPVPNDVKASVKAFIKSMIPIFFSSLIVLPLYYAQMRFHTEISIGGASDAFNSLYAAAHQFALVPSEFFGALTAAVSYQEFYLEQQIVWGVIPVMILLLYIVIAPLERDLNSKDHRLLFFSGAVYFGFMFCLFGANFAASDLFFHSVPAIGKMHFYQRYLVMFNLFFVLVISVVLKLFLIDRYRVSPKVLKSLFFIGLIVIIFVAHLIYGNKGKITILANKFVMEFILAGFFMVVLLFCKPRTSILVATAFLFLTNVGFIYDFHRSSWWDLDNQKKFNIIYDDEKMDTLTTFFDKNSQKDVVKFIDMVPQINESYIPKNYPWFVQGKIALSSYFGYDAHLASDRTYAEHFQVSRDDRVAKMPAIINIPWLKKTGAEFVIFKEGFPENDKELLKYADMSRAIRFPQDTVVAPLMFEKPADERFQNGYVRLISADTAATVQDFKTNDANKMSFTVTTAQPATIQYLFWPNKHLRAFVNGKKASFDRVDEMSVVNVPAGTHKVEIIYKNKAMDVFMVLYLGFLGICALVIGVEGFKKILPAGRKFLGRASLQKDAQTLS